MPWPPGAQLSTELDLPWLRNASSRESDSSQVSNPQLGRHGRFWIEQKKRRRKFRKEDPVNNQWKVFSLTIPKEGRPGGYKASVYTTERKAACLWASEVREQAGAWKLVGSCFLGRSCSKSLKNFPKKSNLDVVTQSKN